MQNAIEYKAVFFGGIGALVESADIERRAYNEAFEDAGLSWNWTEAEYASMQESAEGRDRIAAFAEQRGEDIDTDMLNAKKSGIFQRMIVEGGLKLRPGVAEMIAHAKQNGKSLAWVTTAPQAETDAVFEACPDMLDRSDFVLVMTDEMVACARPAPDCHRFALDQTGLSAGEVLAIEDTPEGVAASVEAGLYSVAFPGAAAPEDRWDGANATVSDLRELI